MGARLNIIKYNLIAIAFSLIFLFVLLYITIAVFNISTKISSGLIALASLGFGKWIYIHAKKRGQMKGEETEISESAEDVVKYKEKGSNMIKTVRRSYWEKIVKKYGDDNFEKIE